MKPILRKFLPPAAMLATSGEDRMLAGAELLQSMLLSLPRYVGAVSLAYFLTFTLRPATAGTVLYYLYITMGELTLAAVRVMGLGAVGDFINRLTGAVWLALTTALGLLIFRRRDLR